MHTGSCSSRVWLGLLLRELERVEGVVLALAADLYTQCAAISVVRYACTERTGGCALRAWLGRIPSIGRR